MRELNRLSDFFLDFFIKQRFVRLAHLYAGSVDERDSPASVDPLNADRITSRPLEVVCNNALLLD